MATKPASLPSTPTKMTVAAFGAEFLGCAARLRVDAVLGQELGAARDDEPALDRADDALADRGVEVA